MEDHLSTRQVAEALSVSESSVKRWCDRGVIPTVRTVGGHRRIPLAGFMEFLETSNREVVVPIAKGPGEQPAPPATEVETGDIQQQFEAALRSGDEATCRQLLTSWYARKGSFSLLADELVALTFHRLGEQWDCGDIEVYQERRGCEICSRVLHEFRRLLPQPPPNAPVALGGTPEGDQYSLPTQLTELVLREQGWRAMNLGPNLPLSTVRAAVEEHKPRLLWLSVSHLTDVHQFIDGFTQLSEALPKETMVVLGGRALTDEIRPKLVYTGHCDNMQQLASLASAILGRRPSIETSEN